jgi:hypothetical protein
VNAVERDGGLVARRVRMIARRLGDGGVRVLVRGRKRRRTRLHSRWR